MPPSKDAATASFAWAKDVTASFALGKDANGNLQRTIYNHMCVQKRLIDT